MGFVSLTPAGCAQILDDGRALRKSMQQRRQPLLALRQGPARLVYHCPKPQPDGKRADLVRMPLELIDRIAALVSPPRTHRHRYFGVLAPNAPMRAAVTAMALAAPGAAMPVPRSPARYLAQTRFRNGNRRLPDGSTATILAFRSRRAAPRRLRPPWGAAPHTKWQAWGPYRDAAGPLPRRHSPLGGAAQHTKWQAWGPYRDAAGPLPRRHSPLGGAAQHTKWQAWGPYSGG
ncbi:transposase [Polaromonas sp.]|uniref:transposase n=1 Tax=Polaromonas sp. TaxID=1869339 RepID=UPI003525E268